MKLFYVRQKPPRMSLSLYRTPAFISVSRVGVPPIKIVHDVPIFRQLYERDRTSEFYVAANESNVSLVEFVGNVMEGL